MLCMPTTIIEAEDEVEAAAEAEVKERNGDSSKVVQQILINEDASFVIPQNT